MYPILRTLRGHRSGSVTAGRAERSSGRRYGPVMPRPDRNHALDHIVVIMFENRSFDNLLGRLYEPGEVASFEGVAGRDLSNPVPDWAAGPDPGTAPRLVPYGTAVNMNTPSPDPGEEYPHVNTQLFGLIDPPANRGMVAQHIVAPYNAPADPGQRPIM